MEGIVLKCGTRQVPFKDFVGDSRCFHEVLRFLERGFILLNLQANCLDDVLQHMLSKVQNEVSEKEFASGIYATYNKQLLKEVFRGFDTDSCRYEESWICITSVVSSLASRQVVIATLNSSLNVLPTMEKVCFVILVLTPEHSKCTKNDQEVAAIYSTLFANTEFRHMLKKAEDAHSFKQIMIRRAQRLTEHSETSSLDSQKSKISLKFCDGLRSDFTRRAKYYVSDYTDGLFGEKTIQKTISTICFLYFAIILPCIAFGVRAGNVTRGAFDSQKALIGQTMGGLFFGLFSGQHLVIIMTTAPLCLYTKVIFDISHENHWNFNAVYTCVAYWTGFLVILYSIFDFSKVMKFCTRSTEEIFAVFSFFAFAVDAIIDISESFKHKYAAPACKEPLSNVSYLFDNLTEHMHHDHRCYRDVSLLYLMLVAGTVLLAVALYNVLQTSFFTFGIRETISDYALPAAVLTFSFIASYFFRDIPIDRFSFSGIFEVQRSRVEDLPIGAVFTALVLSFPLSLLFFMDQNISAAMVNNRDNKLKKGPAYHLDLLVVGILNMMIASYGFPLMHGMLPHSPLHARSLATVESKVIDGHKVDVVIKARETRIPVIVAHLLIGITAFYLIPYPLAYIPVPVLNGLFIYCAVASLRGNEIVERVYLFIREQAAYPPTHYIRKCKQVSIHLFTVTQLMQTAMLCFSAFSPWPYLRMAYPVIIAVLVPIRHFFLPTFISPKDLNVLDSVTGDSF